MSRDNDLEAERIGPKGPDWAVKFYECTMGIMSARRMREREEEDDPCDPREFWMQVLMLITVFLIVVVLL